MSISDSGTSLSIWDKQLIVYILVHDCLDHVPISFRSCTKKKKRNWEMKKINEEILEDENEEIPKNKWKYEEWEVK